MGNQIRRLALKHAFQSTSRYRLGAVASKGRRGLSWASNDMGKTDPASPHPFRCVHAEAKALKNCRGKADTIFVARVNQEGQLAMARPCEHCWQYLKTYGIRRVVLHYGRGVGV